MFFAKNSQGRKHVLAHFSLVDGVPCSGLRPREAQTVPAPPPFGTDAVGMVKDAPWESQQSSVGNPVPAYSEF
jgi:hypothetical protein